MGELFVNVILPLYLLIGIGYLFGKLKKDLDTSSISFLVLYFFAPVLVFSSFKEVELPLKYSIFVALGSLWVFVFTYLFSRFVARGKGPAFYLSATVMNAGYLGIPLIYLLFGEKALPYAVSYMVFMAVYHFTLGIVILNPGKLKEGVVSAFKIPLIYSAVLAFLFKGVNLPSGIEEILKLTGNSTMPLMLVSIGVSLSKVSFSEVKDALLGTALRFLGGTLGALLIVKLLPVPSLLGKVLVVQSSLPSAVLNFVLCQRFNRSPEVAASIIFLSTLAFPLYFPLLKLLLNLVF
ncbi:AEC family transporter [Thermovibrio sp.]